MVLHQGNYRGLLFIANIVIYHLTIPQILGGSCGLRFILEKCNEN